MPWSVTELIGPYRVARQLSNGGMANIFEVLALNGTGRLALKQSRPGENEKKSLETEYRVLSSIHHDGVVRAHTLGDAGDGTAYMTMDLLSGIHPLYFAQNLGPPGHPARTIGVLGIIADISAAVQALHDAGWIHRDIKSANVMVLSDGRSILIDPGAACLRSGHQHRGGFIGTRAYAAPEQMLGRMVDERADVYALGVLSYRLLTGKKPYDATDTYQCLQQKLSQDVPSVQAHCPELDQQTTQLLQQMMSPDVCGRPSVAQVQQAMSNCQMTPIDDPAHRRRLLLAIACSRQPVSSVVLQQTIECSEDVLYAHLLSLMNEGLIRAADTGWRLRASSLQTERP